MPAGQRIPLSEYRENAHLPAKKRCPKFYERYEVHRQSPIVLEERWYFDEWDKALSARGLIVNNNANNIASVRITGIALAPSIGRAP